MDDMDQLFNLTKSKGLAAMLFIVIAVILSIASCSEDSFPDESLRKPSKKINLLWRKPLVPDPKVDYTIAMNPVLYDSVVIFGTEYNLHGKHAPVLFMDTADGLVLDSWSDYIDGNGLYSAEATAKEGDLLVMSTLSSIDCLNLKTRQTQWRKIIPNNSAYIYTQWNKIFSATKNPDDRKATLISLMAQSGNLTPIYQFSRTDKFIPFFDAFGFGTLAGGDQIIVWKNRSSSGNDYRSDIFAYNLTSDTLLWRNKDFDLPSSIIPLKVLDQNVYGLVSEHAFSIELETGIIRWKTNLDSLINPRFPIGFWDGDLFVHDNKIFIYGDSDELTILDESNGKLIKVLRNFSGYLKDRFTYFEDKLFFSTGHLQIVDLNTGERLVEDSFTEEIDDIRSRIVIDSTRRVMYFHNGREAFCARIPKDL